MNTVDLVHYALGFAFDVLGAVTADLTQEQVNWAPPGTVNTIGAIYSHILTYVDYMVRNISTGERYEVFLEAPPPEIMMHPVEADLPALQTKAAEIRRDALNWLSTQTPADLECRFETTIGELNLGQTIEAYLVWHINAHCGEIAALKGCQGAKGYPW